jgi:hypothetical protein
MVFGAAFLRPANCGFSLDISRFSATRPAFRRGRGAFAHSADFEILNGFSPDPVAATQYRFALSEAVGSD